MSKVNEKAASWKKNGRLDLEGASLDKLDKQAYDIAAAEHALIKARKELYRNQIEMQKYNLFEGMLKYSLRGVGLVNDGLTRDVAWSKDPSHTVVYSNFAKFSDVPCDAICRGGHGNPISDDVNEVLDNLYGPGNKALDKIKGGPEYEIAANYAKALIKYAYARDTSNDMFYEGDTIAEKYNADVENWFYRRVSDWRSAMNGYTEIPSDTKVAIKAEDFENDRSSDFIIEDGELKLYIGCESHASIPDGVKTIGSCAFAKYDGLISVSISEGVETIEDDAFAGTNLVDVKLPSSIKRIDISEVAANKTKSDYAELKKLRRAYEPEPSFDDADFDDTNDDFDRGPTDD